MASKWPSKDPNEVLDYAIDWSTRRPLAGDTILTAQSTVVDPPAGSPVVVDSTDIDGLITRTWLSGGTTGQTYNVLVRITTAAGRVADQTVKIQIKDR